MQLHTMCVSTWHLSVPKATCCGMASGARKIDVGACFLVMQSRKPREFDSLCQSSTQEASQACSSTQCVCVHGIQVRVKIRVRVRVRFRLGVRVRIGVRVGV